jgi:hypothetical protein
MHMITKWWYVTKMKFYGYRIIMYIFEFVMIIKMKNKKEIKRKYLQNHKNLII